MFGTLTNDLVQENEGGYTLLHYACASGNYDIFDYIRKHTTNLGSILFDKDNST
jgi:ankyrin repeat protein